MLDPKPSDLTMIRSNKMYRVQTFFIHNKFVGLAQ